MLPTYNNVVTFERPYLYGEFASLALARKDPGWGDQDDLFTSGEQTDHAMSQGWRRKWGITAFRLMPSKSKVCFSTRGAPAVAFMEGLTTEFTAFRGSVLYFIAPSLQAGGQWSYSDGPVSVPTHASRIYSEAWSHVFGMPAWLTRPRKRVHQQQFFRVELINRAETFVYSEPSRSISWNDALVRGLVAFKSSLLHCQPELGEMAVVTGPYSLGLGPAPIVEEHCVLLDEQHLASADELRILP